MKIYLTIEGTKKEINEYLKLKVTSKSFISNIEKEVSKLLKKELVVTSYCISSGACISESAQHSMTFAYYGPALTPKKKKLLTK